ncbi:hypothetical protein H5T87_08190 [bacterium]|nr:hypothetical protein [bacterium]
MADPISVVLHAHWTPDLTVQNQQGVCVFSGTVAGGLDFHTISWRTILLP